MIISGGHKVPGQCKIYHRPGNALKKIKNFGIYFISLGGYLGMFRKSQVVWERNFDPKGVNASHTPNLCTLCPLSV